MRRNEKGLQLHALVPSNFQGCSSLAPSSTPPFLYTPPPVILLYCHLVTLPHCYTATLSHCYQVTIYSISMINMKYLFHFIYFNQEHPHLPISYGLGKLVTTTQDLLELSFRVSFPAE